MNWRAGLALLILAGLGYGLWWLNARLVLQGWVSWDGQSWKLVAQGWGLVRPGWILMALGVLAGVALTLIVIIPLLLQTQTLDHAATVERLTQEREQALEDARGAYGEAKAKLASSYEEAEKRENMAIQAQLEAEKLQSMANQEVIAMQIQVQQVISKAEDHQELAQRTIANAQHKTHNAQQAFARVKSKRR